MIYAGIDPGLKGGICVHGVCYPMPVDDDGIRVADLALILSGVDQVLIEKVHAMPKQGVCSMFTFGYGAGQVNATACIVTKNPPKYVQPQEWKKKVLGDRFDHDKKGTAAWAASIFPHAHLVAPRGRVIHDGMADALAIYYYATLYL